MDKDDLYSILWKKKLLILIFLVNLIGTAFGYYYYQWQLQETSKYLWIFVPDCPNATLLLMIALLLNFTDINVKGRRTFNFLTSAYLIKYGIWTVFTILFFTEYFLAPPNMYYYLILMTGHAGMALESIIILPISKIHNKKKLKVSGVLIWLFINDLADYILGTRPYLGPSPDPLKIQILAVITVLLSIISVIVIIFYPKIRT